MAGPWFPSGAYPLPRRPSDDLADSDVGDLLRGLGVLLLATLAGSLAALVPRAAARSRGVRPQAPVHRDPPVSECRRRDPRIGRPPPAAGLPRRSAPDHRLSG